MWIFYWINVLDNLSNVLCGVIVLLIFLIIMSFIAFAASFDKYLAPEKLRKPAKTACIIFTVLWMVAIMLAVFIPNKETMYTMVAAKGAEILVSTPEASKAREAVNLGLDKIIKELKN